MDKYLPRLSVGKAEHPTMRVKRNCNRSILPQSHDKEITQLPVIRRTGRSHSLSDSSSTSTSNGSSSNGIPIIEITDLDGVSAEMKVSLKNRTSSGNRLSTDTLHLASQPSRNGSNKNAVIYPCPPKSPHPPNSGHGISETTPNSQWNRKRNSFGRSKHFELTLQNIEEVRDLDLEGGVSPSSSGDAPHSGSVGDGVGAQNQSYRTSGTQHRRSYSTPVEYRELRKKIAATRLVSMGDMSMEFTQSYLARKGPDRPHPEDMVRRRCIDWLKSLNSS